LVHASNRHAVHDDPSWPRTRGVVHCQPNHTSHGTDWSTPKLAFCDFCGATTTLPYIAHGAVSARPRRATAGAGKSVFVGARLLSVFVRARSLRSLSGRGVRLTS